MSAHTELVLLGKKKLMFVVLELMPHICTLSRIWAMSHIRAQPLVTLMFVFWEHLVLHYLCLVLLLLCVALRLMCVCVCVCVCARARACVSVWVCA